MESQTILIFGSFISLILLCLCIRYCKDNQRGMNKKIHIKKLLKCKNIIKSIMDAHKNFNEEVKD
jgi:hypothetical protein